MLIVSSPAEKSEFVNAVKECRNVRFGIWAAFDNYDERANILFTECDALDFALAIEDYEMEFEKMFPDGGTFDEKEWQTIKFRNLLAISHAYFSCQLSDEAKKIIQWFVKQGAFYHLVSAAVIFCNNLRETNKPFLSPLNSGSPF